MLSIASMDLSGSSLGRVKISNIPARADELCDQIDYILKTGS